MYSEFKRESQIYHINVDNKYNVSLPFDAPPSMASNHSLNTHTHIHKYEAQDAIMDRELVTMPIVYPKKI